MVIQSKVVSFGRCSAFARSRLPKARCIRTLFSASTLSEAVVLADRPIPTLAGFHLCGSALGNSAFRHQCGNALSVMRVCGGSGALG